MSGVSPSPIAIDQFATQIRRMVERGLIPLIEHTGDTRPGARLWTMWKLPMFEATTPEQIRAELEACAAAFPDHRVRLIGYERARQLAAMCLETHPGGR